MRNRLAWQAAVVGLGVIVVFAQRGNAVAEFTAFSVALAAVTLLLWLTMRFSGVIHRGYQ